MGLHGEERRRAVDERLLEQAPTPADACHTNVACELDGDAVGGARQLGERTDVGEHLVPALGPRPDDGRDRQAAGKLDDRLGNRPRRVGVEDVTLGDVQPLDAMTGERGERSS